MNQGRGAAAVLERQLCPSRAVLPAQHSVCHLDIYRCRFLSFIAVLGWKAATTAKRAGPRGWRVAGAGLSVQVLAASQFPAHRFKLLEVFDQSHCGASTWGRVSGVRRGF